jgi:Tol biopolymer transport system component
MAETAGAQGGGSAGVRAGGGAAGVEAGSGAAGATASGAAAGGGTGTAGATMAGTGTSGPWLFFDSLRGLNRDVYAVLADGSALHRITTSPATEREPAVSPDGRTLAFSSDDKGSFQILLMPLPSGTPRLLTSDPNGAQQPSWSADGTRLAYHNDLGVWVVGADGQGTRSVVGIDGQTSQNEYPVFAPSGRALIFDRFNQIHQVDLDSAVETSIVHNWTTTIQHPSVSPDGHSIAFDVWCDASGLSIWIVPLAADTDPCLGGTRVTTPVSGPARFPSFSPTGLIAFEHGTGTNDGSGGAGGGAVNGKARIAVVAPGSDPKDVTQGDDDRNPSWSTAALVLP